MPIDTQFKLLKFRRTKIVATLGPSSDRPERIRALIAAGVNVFRLNMSHGSHDDHRATYGHVRGQAEALGAPVAVLADLCGPKIRVGKFAQGKIQLEAGSSVTVTTRDTAGRQGLIPSQYAALADDVLPGNRILLDDGNLELRAESVKGTEIRCTVINGGWLRNHKGMNLPGVEVSAPSLTEKDRADAAFALELGVDFLALSFVRRPEDVLGLRELVEAAGGRAAIISKIEKPEALKNIDAIMEASDGIMVARGDLGVELPPQAVPTAQSQLIGLARRHLKPVIVATQMLESMVTNPRPTRAEVTDVAFAVSSGADAVMLSAETAAGEYPVEAVAMMDTIARQTEGYLWDQGAFGTLSAGPPAAVDRPSPAEDAIARSTAQLSRDLLVRAVLVISIRGRSAAVMSASRPAAPILGITADPWVACTMSLLWGVWPVVVPEEEVGRARHLARRFAPEFGLAKPGETVLVVRGFSHDPSSNTPSVTVVTV